MRTLSGRTAVLALPLALALAACGAETEEPTRAESPQAAAPEPAKQPAEPETAEDFLDLAEQAMAEEPAWGFSVKGEEGLTLQGQKSAATYEGTVRRAVGRTALHAQGVSTGSKGTKKTEELYVVDGAGYLKEGTAGWKALSPAGPGMRNKVEDPIAVVEEFRGYARAAGGEVEVTEADGGGTIELRVTSGERKLSAVRDRAWAKKAKREFDPTAGQLREAGVPVEDAQMTLSGLEEVLVLDATSYRIRSHRFEFGFLIPYNGQDIAFEQRVTEENQGPYRGRIELPAGVAG
ncbi:hypothetical protein [Streptomyces griseomycini]|uniref:Lipoprotein n=1 Tax=Streptomyces griseomycini TaxID=66895 RepID=A0A7W7LVT2_9ACTN|nr:hypothetical protein [Streptomyces griseomycini]MBB4897282.1 hypothetical protein [Streptomyces griseomycini]GGR33447.1 hypothetical protein GCM10015536_43720 [Streptomyces griseomycini]